MQGSRAENSKRNLIYGIVANAVTLLLPFVTRTVLIHELGAKYLGLNGLFTSILTVLSVAELGFSQAIVYSMYKPIAENNTEEVNALLKLYKKIYHAIGMLILFVGLLLIPFLPNLVSGDIPADISLVNVYLIYLFNTSISYFAFSYYKSLLSAFQRNDILSRITMAARVFQYLAQVAIAILFHNYYVYAIVLPLSTVLDNLLVAYIVRKKFPQYMCQGEVDSRTKREISKNMKGLVIDRFCGVSRNSFDSIFISMFLGLTEVAIYNNYYYILSAVSGVLGLVGQSITASVGNSIAIETKEKNYSTMNSINFIFMWISGWCMICMLCLYQPFMKLWMGEELCLPKHSMILFCMYFYALRVGDIQGVYKNASGLYFEYRKCAVAQMIVNVLLNYFLGKYYGINGIVLATLISIVGIEVVFGHRIVFRHYFQNNKEGEYYRHHCLYMFITVTIALVTAYVAKGFGLIPRAVICCVVPNVLYILVYHRLGIYQKSVKWILEILGISNEILNRLLLLKP